MRDNIVEDLKNLFITIDNYGALKKKYDMILHDTRIEDIISIDYADEEIWLIAIKGSANSIFAHTSPSEQMIALHKLLWEI